MNDMAAVIEPKSDQVNADSLLSGPMTVTIKDVKISPGTEQPVSIVLEETPLFYRPCKSMSRVLVSAWGPDAKKYIGRSMTLYRDPTVTWGGVQVGGIRISHMSHITEKKTMALTATRATRKPFTVQPLQQSDAPQTEDAAQIWAGAFRAKLDTLLTVEAIEALVAEKAGKLKELETARPDLYLDVRGAIARRKDEISAPAEEVTE